VHTLSQTEQKRPRHFEPMPALLNQDRLILAAALHILIS